MITYYQVFEHTDEIEGKKKRLVWTFEKELDAFDLIDFLSKTTYKADLQVQEIKHSNNWNPTKLA